MPQRRFCSVGGNRRSISAQVIPINESGKLLEAYNIRLDENCVVDMKFLHSPLGGRPLLAVLSEDTRRARHIKTYEVGLREKVSTSELRRFNKYGGGQPEHMKHSLEPSAHQLHGCQSSGGSH